MENTKNTLKNFINLTLFLSLLIIKKKETDL